MNIVVTGATSFVGTGAVKELLDRGHCVLLFSERTPQRRTNSCKMEKYRKILQFWKKI